MELYREFRIKGGVREKAGGGVVTKLASVAITGTHCGIQYCIELDLCLHLS